MAWSSTFSTTQRTYPDVSCDADPDSGVPIYDSYDFGTSTPWVPPMGGTSLACPLWAGIVAVADEGRAIAGQGSLDGPSQTLPDLYKLPAADFHDITSGNNGPYSAGPGYDLVTGIGSPVGNLLVPAAWPTARGLHPGCRLAQPRHRPPCQRPISRSLGGEGGSACTGSPTPGRRPRSPAAPAPPTFAVNGTNAAKDTTATFSTAGTYVLTVNDHRSRTG